LPAYVLVRVCRSCVEAKKKWTEEQKVKQAAQQAAEKKENQK
jgi:hypothetical protein